ncbi:MAG: hypothetical protein K2X48_10815 [Chitinophagaceae bacterium]|nr:hypothetical protein [Chitinophagaceae bacterium]
MKKGIERKLHDLLNGSYGLPVPGSWFRSLLFAVCFLMLGSFNVHPYYMSVTELEYRPAQKEIQISCKIFADDLEEAVKADSKKTVNLFDEKQKAINQTYILNYLKKHLKITVDGKAVPYEMLGFEKEEEAMWNFLVIRNIASAKKVTVFNDVLYNLRDGQINILHFKTKNNTQSYRLNAPELQHPFNL